MNLPAVAVLVPCSKSKGGARAPARELYATSRLFRAGLAFGRLRAPTTTFVLSALHGLVELDTVLDPYDVTSLGDPYAAADWGRAVLHRLAPKLAPGAVVISLAGERYTAPVRAAIKSSGRWLSVLEPLAGLSVGRRYGALRDLAREV